MADERGTAELPVVARRCYHQNLVTAGQFDGVEQYVDTEVVRGAHGREAFERQAQIDHSGTGGDDIRQRVGQVGGCGRRDVDPGDGTYDEGTARADTGFLGSGGPGGERRDDERPMARGSAGDRGGDRGADEPDGPARQIRVAGVDGSVDHTDHDIGASSGACRESRQTDRFQGAGQSHVGLTRTGWDFVSFPSQSMQDSTAMVVPKSSQ